MSAMMRSVLMFNGNLGNSMWLRALGGPVGRCVSVMLNKNIYTEVGPWLSSNVFNCVGYSFVLVLAFFAVNGAVEHETKPRLCCARRSATHLISEGTVCEYRSMLCSSAYTVPFGPKNRRSSVLDTYLEYTVVHKRLLVGGTLMESRHPWEQRPQ